MVAMWSSLRFTLLSSILVAAPPSAAGLSASSLVAANSEAHAQFLGPAKKPVLIGEEVKVVVAALGEIVKGMEAEQKAAETLAKNRDKECKEYLGPTAPATKAIKEGQKMIAEAKANLATVTKEVNGLQANVEGKELQVRETRNKIAELGKKLKALRKKMLSAQKRSKNSLLHIDAVVDLESRREDEEATEEKQGGGGVKINQGLVMSEVANLQDLDRQLGASSTDSAEEAATTTVTPAATASASGTASDESTEASDDDDATQVSFLQVAGAGAGAGASGQTQMTAAASAAHALQQDRAELVRARNEANKDFVKQENKLIKLIESQRKALIKLEETVDGMQTVLVDKLQQQAETNRTVAMGARVLLRDIASNKASKKTCALQLKSYRNINRQRFEAINLVKMPIEFLKNMKAYLQVEGGSSQDNHTANASVPASAPSFLQVDADDSSSSGLGRAVLQAVHAFGADAVAEAEAEAGVPHDAAGSSGHSLAQVSAGEAASIASDASASATGPFDEVQGMLRTLISNLNDQANKDTNLHQWCVDSRAENDNSRIKAKQAMDAASASALWARSAIAKLKEEITYFGKEVKRLDTHAKNEAKANAKELRIINQQLADHKGARDHITNILSVLATKCDVSAKDLRKALRPVAQKNYKYTQKMGFLAEDGEGDETETKEVAEGTSGQCKEAVKLLFQAGLKLKSLDKAVAEYKTSYTTLSRSLVQATAEAVKQRKTDLTYAKSSKSSREKDLQTALALGRQKKKDLGLVAKAAVAVEKKCSVRVTREERMARVQSEIDALNSAYKVLNGEEIPVSNSLIALNKQSTDEH